MKQKAFFVFVICMGIYSALCGVLYCVQAKLLYFPQGRAVNEQQATWHMQSAGEDIIITTKIRSGNRAIIYFGGNGEDVSLNLKVFEREFPEHSLYLMHYRGYGGSSGKPSEQGIYQDALVLYKSVYTRHKHISLIGRSLGSGIATRLASELPAKHLVLITPYSSIEDVAKEKYPFVPIRLLLRDKYKSWQYAQQVHVPTTILSAENDLIIPKHSTEKLYKSFPQGVANLILIKQVGHNTISASGQYYSLIQKAIGL